MKTMVMTLGAFILVVSFSLTVLDAIAEDGDWPYTLTIHPTTELKTPQPGEHLGISYPCKWKSSDCDLDDFMEHLDVCALYVLHKGTPVLHRVASENEDCAEKVSRERYGIASITKSITSLILGYVILSTDLNLKTTISDELGRIGINYPNKKVTIRDLLRMSSGMNWNEKREKESIRINEHSDPDTLKQVVAGRLENAVFKDKDVGKYNYSGFDTTILGLVIAGRWDLEQSIDKVLEEQVWKPQGMRKKAEWKADADRFPSPHCCFYASAGDLAILGQWVLQKYKSGQDQIANWIRQSISDSRETDESCKFKTMEQEIRYGYQWRVLSGDGNGFTAYGAGGQYMHVFPDQDVVVVQLSSDARVSSENWCEAFLVQRAIADKVAQ
ncbi:MAG: hypothetical protein DHS20C01_22260 [marine bacterium B5-7]|nr:MAG: hypothetical protein DHS20C01_22260 [marine bacterium B5-7]